MSFRFRARRCPALRLSAAVAPLPLALALGAGFAMSVRADEPLSSAIGRPDADSFVRLPLQFGLCAAPGVDGRTMWRSVADGEYAAAFALPDFAREPWPADPAAAETIPLPESRAGQSGQKKGGQALPLPTQPDMPRAQQRNIGPVRVEKFTHLTWSELTNALHADGTVTMTYTDPATKISSTLQARDADYDPATGQLVTKGESTLIREDSRARGENAQYNLADNTGRLENAVVVSDFFRMNGALIERLPDGSFRLTNGDFTTCIHGRPDYTLHVKDLTVQPNEYIKAHNVQLTVGGFTLPAIPYLRRGLRSSATLPFPTPGYNKSEGFTLQFYDPLIERPYETLDLSLHFNVKRLPTGFLIFQHDIGQSPVRKSPPRTLLPTYADPLSGVLELASAPTYREYISNQYGPVSEPRATGFAAIQNQQYVYNRRRTDLLVSRFPEVGLQFYNILGRPFATTDANGDSTIPDALTNGVGNVARFRTPNTPALLNVTAGLGEFLERPTNVAAFRFGIRANLSSQPLLLGTRLSLRAALAEFLNIYSTGTVYQMMAPEVELDFAPTRNSLFNVGYRYVTDIGRTPFAFDRRDIRHELRLQYQVSGPWGFAIASKIDLERSRAYDGELAVARNFDCMQVGVSYRLRSQSFNLIFSLLPPQRNKARPLIPIRGRS